MKTKLAMHTGDAAGLQPGLFKACPRPKGSSGRCLSRGIQAPIAGSVQKRPRGANAILLSQCGTKILSGRMRARAMQGFGKVLTLCHELFFLTVYESAGTNAVLPAKPPKIYRPPTKGSSWHRLSRGVQAALFHALQSKQSRFRH